MQIYFQFSFFLWKILWISSNLEKRNLLKLIIVVKILCTQRIYIDSNNQNKQWIIFNVVIEIIIHVFLFTLINVFHWVIEKIVVIVIEKVVVIVIEKVVVIVIEKVVVIVIEKIVVIFLISSFVFVHVRRVVKNQR